MKRNLLVVCGLAIGLVAAGCGGGNGNGDGPAANAERETDRPGKEMLTERLTEQELREFLDIWPEFVEKMKKYQPGKNFWAAGGLVANAEIKAYLASKGTNLQEVAQTLAKVSMAQAAYGAREALRKTEGMPPQARASMEASLEAFKDVPQENIDLVQEHLEKIKAAMAAGASE